MEWITRIRANKPEWFQIQCQLNEINLPGDKANQHLIPINPLPFVFLCGNDWWIKLRLNQTWNWTSEVSFSLSECQKGWNEVNDWKKIEIMSECQQAEEKIELPEAEQRSIQERMNDGSISETKLNEIGLAFFVCRLQIDWNWFIAPKHSQFQFNPANNQPNFPKPLHRAAWRSCSHPIQFPLNQFKLQLLI